ALLALLSSARMLPHCVGGFAPRVLHPVMISKGVPAEDTARSMGDIVFQNTLGGKHQPFVPLHPGQVRMYTCGPTVYDFAHIGNFRTFVFQDILRRFLRSRGFAVTQVTNFTDVDDRIIAKAAEAKLDIRDFTAKYIEAFLADQRVLGIKEPEYMRSEEHTSELQ